MNFSVLSGSSSIPASVSSCFPENRPVKSGWPMKTSCAPIIFSGPAASSNAAATWCTRHCCNLAAQDCITAVSSGCNIVADKSRSLNATNSTPAPSIFGRTLPLVSIVYSPRAQVKRIWRRELASETDSYQTLPPVPKSLTLFQ